MTAHPHDDPARPDRPAAEWPHLPPAVRALVEERCGSPVVDGRLAGRRLHARLRVGAHLRGRVATLREGRLGQGPADVRRRLPRGGPQAGALPAAVPAPRLLWSHDGDWVVLETEYVEGRAAASAVAASRPRRRPRRPRAGGRELTPAPAELRPGHRSPTSSPTGRRTGTTSRRRAPDLPHLDDAAALAAGFAEVTAGDTLVHTDVRDDNMLLRPDGRRVLCDWNWPVVGAAWLDTLFLMIGPRGDGLDVDAVLARPAADPRRARRARRQRARAGRRLLLQVRGRAGAADLAVHPRRPALAGRGASGGGSASGAAGDAHRGRSGVRAQRGPRCRSRVRAWVEDHARLAGVVEAHEQVGGMSPGCATRVVGADGQPGLRQGGRHAS